MINSIRILSIKSNIGNDLSLCRKDYCLLGKWCDGCCRNTHLDCVERYHIITNIYIQYKYIYECMIYNIILARHTIHSCISSMPSFSFFFCFGLLCYRQAMDDALYIQLVSSAFSNTQTHNRLYCMDTGARCLGIHNARIYDISFFYTRFIYLFVEACSGSQRFSFDRVVDSRNNMKLKPNFHYS